MTDCQMPPEGWTCTRQAGHDGPCAAVPDYEAIQNWSSQPQCDKLGSHEIEDLATALAPLFTPSQKREAERRSIEEIAQEALDLCAKRAIAGEYESHFATGRDVALAAAEVALAATPQPEQEAERFTVAEIRERLKDHEALADATLQMNVAFHDAAAEIEQAEAAIDAALNAAFPEFTP